MRIRRPPGRAGRLWLLRRLRVARTGYDALEQKRRALGRELDRLDGLIDDARRDWDDRARNAEVWWHRAAVLTGERTLELACKSVRLRADVALDWRNALGVVYPYDVSVSIPHTEVFPAGGSAALAVSAETHRHALEAAAALGATELARERTERELRATTRRLRVLERRWIPAHEQSLREVELALDETDREEAARVRWVVRRHERTRSAPRDARSDRRRESLYAAPSSK
jgi:V/A-type H+-transporting ATPase subunit D